MFNVIKKLKTVLSERPGGIFIVPQISRDVDFVHSLAEACVRQCRLLLEDEILGSVTRGHNIKRTRSDTGKIDVTIQSHTRSNVK